MVPGAAGSQAAPLAAAGAVDSPEEAGAAAGSLAAAGAEALEGAEKRVVKNSLKNFPSKNGTSLSRLQSWREMKRICKTAGVEASKVFPHNLRRLFATTFYRVTKDIAKLMDVLGRSSINTTRIYLLSTDIKHVRCIERHGLVC